MVEKKKSSKMLNSHEKGLHRPQRKGLLQVRWLRRFFTKLLMVIRRDYNEPGTVLKALYTGLQYN